MRVRYDRDEIGRGHGYRDPGIGYVPVVTVAIAITVAIISAMVTGVIPIVLVALCV